jgi:hypothetical protein
MVTGGVQSNARETDTVVAYLAANFGPECLDLAARETRSRQALTFQGQESE